MTEDQQAGTLAFLQNFYTNVTLYVPREAAEPAPASSAVAAPAPSAPVIAAAPVAAQVTAAPPPAAAQMLPATAVEPGPGKLPSLASLPTPAVVTPPRPVAPVAPLVGAAPAAAPAAPAPTTSPVAPYLLTQFNTLGSNAQGVVILVRLPEERFRKLPRNVFLNKLLQAIRLVMADVVLVNVDGPYPVALENLRREIAATQVLAFGRNLLDVAIRTTQIYEPVLFPNLGLSYLAAAEVEMVEYDNSLKKRLWSGLQAMFL